MADAGVARDRLPWLEPYRAPQPKKRKKAAGNRASVAAIGAITLAGVITLLVNRGAPLLPANEPAPTAQIVLPAPADMQPQIVLPPLGSHPEQLAEVPAVERIREATPRRAAQPRRKIKAVPTRTAYREVVKEQAGKPAPPAPVVSEAALAIAALPLPPDPPRPAVDPTAQVVRGKTVQLGVYTTARQAEAAWRSAVRDYTYLVTMPQSIEPISIRSKRFYRLQLGTPSKKHAKQLCTNLKSIGRACTVA